MKDIIYELWQTFKYNNLFKVLRHCRQPIQSLVNDMNGDTVTNPSFECILSFLQIISVFSFIPKIYRFLGRIISFVHHIVRTH